MSKVDDQPIELKQEYLRKEIIDKNYDPEEFINFFQEVNVCDDFDLDYVKLEDLKDIVIKFQNFSNSGKITERRRSTMIKASDMNRNINPEQSDIPSYKKTSLTTTNIVLSEDNEIDEMLSCQKMEKSPLFAIKNLAIKVGEPILVKGGVLQSSYTIYSVKVPELNTEVQRRFRDFEWLREELRHQFPGVIIPPIPGKQVFDNLNSSLTYKRMRHFQHFLDHLCSMSCVKASNILYEFLTISDDSEFKRRKLFYENKEGVYRLNETQNLEGILYSRFNREYSKQAKIIREYVNINELLLSKLNLAYDSLKIDFENISNTLIGISDIYKQLHLSSDEYNNPAPITDTFKMLEKLNKQWSSNYKKQINVFEVDFKEFFDYFRRELENMKEPINSYQDCKEEYLRFHTTLKNKKEKLFKTQSLAKWEMNEDDYNNSDASLLQNKEAAFKLMCRKETLALEDIRRKLGVSCYSLIHDFVKIRGYHAIKIKNHFINLCGKNKEVLADAFGLVRLIHMNAEDLKNYKEYSYEKNYNEDENDSRYNKDQNNEEEKDTNLEEEVEYKVRCDSVTKKTMDKKLNRQETTITISRDNEVFSDKSEINDLNNQDIIDKDQNKEEENL